MNNNNNLLKELVIDAIFFFKFYMVNFFYYCYFLNYTTNRYVFLCLKEIRRAELGLSGYYLLV